MTWITAAAVAVAFVLVDRFFSDFTGLGVLIDQAIEAAVLAATTAFVLRIFVIRPLRLEADSARAISAAREAKLRAEACRQEFEAALHRAVEMAENEDATYQVAAKAIRRGIPLVDVELLLADSSDAHLKRAVEVGGDERRARCGVVAPRECPAIRRAQTLTFASSESLDACPYLENRSAGPCAAVCVPVSVGGHSIGVLHAATDPATPLTVADTATLETVATQAGSRIGMLRVMEATHLQAATDPLTGLLNRRSFENQAKDLQRRKTRFSLAMGDLDHFKRLNDTHGHDGGDRALRAFSQTLRSALRSEDLVCRYGGEEFVIVFPERSASEAAAALERVQQELLLCAAGGAIPPFTVSFGVAHSDEAASLEELCRIADSALFKAKRDGRNRVVIDTASFAGLDQPSSALDPTESLAALIA